MAFRNFINFCLCFVFLLLFVNVIPSAKDVLFYFSSFIVLLRLSEWLMSFTKKFMLNPKVKCDGKAVCITGCDSGFGHQLAIRLDGLGYHVFAGCLYGEGEGAKYLQSSCSSRLKTLPLDVTSEESVQEALKFVKENLKDNDLWAVVNNAGIAQTGEIDWCPMEDLQNVMEINAMGTVRVTKAFLPLIRESKGRIVNNTSLFGRMTIAGCVGYCMSKTAAVYFTTGLRIEMKKWGVHVTSIEPFFYRTPLTNAPAVMKQLDSSWKKVTEDNKITYGEEYFNAFKKTNLNAIKLCSPHIHEVIDCFEDAITSCEPLDSYFPCYFPHKVALKLGQALPAIVHESYQRTQMPFFVKPARLTKKFSASEKYHSNGKHLETAKHTKEEE